MGLQGKGELWEPVGSPRGDHGLLCVAADLDPTSLHVESMVAHKLAGLDVLGAHDARLEAVHHLAGRLFQCVAVLESPSSTTTDNLPMGFLIYPQRMYCKKGKVTNFLILQVQKSSYLHLGESHVL